MPVTLGVHVSDGVATTSQVTLGTITFGAILNRVLPEEWKSALHFSSLDSEWREKTFELILEARLLAPDFEKSVTVLIDTGCRIPLLFRQGLFPQIFIVQG